MKRSLALHKGRPALMILTTALPLLVLAGCQAVGPDFKTPDVKNTPSRFQNAPVGITPSPAATPSQASASITTSVDSREWWRVFEDPQLDRLQKEALANSPSLSLVSARVAEARARLGLATADKSPALSGSAASRLAGESSERTLPIPGRPVNYRDDGDTYRLALDASWEPDLWGRIRRANESASAQMRASEADERAARLTLTADVATAYTLLRGLDAERAILTSSRALRADSAGLLATRHAAGLAPETDALRARAELASLDAELADLERRRSLALDGLALLCGQAVSEFQLQFSATPGAASALPQAPALPAGIPAEVLRRRPDIAAAEETLHARNAEIGVAEAARYPSIRLTAGGGLESPDLSRLLDRPSQFWQIGPVLSVPLLDGGRIRAGVEVALARAEAARAEHRQRCLVALREVEDALVELREYANQAKALAQGLESSREAATLLRTRHAAGYATYLEVIDADRSALLFERGLAQNSTARLASTVRLIRALGGAW